MSDTQQSYSDQRDSAQLWRVEAFGGLELFRARFTEFMFSSHAHEEYMIVVTESGFGRPHFRGSDQQIRAGDVIILSPGEVHYGGPAERAVWCYRTFYPSTPLMQRIVEEVAGAARGIPQFDEAVVSHPITGSLLLKAHLTLEQPNSALACESWLLEALARLVASHAAGGISAHQIGDEHRAVKLVKDYLEALPAENVSLDTLSQAAGISAFRLCRVFRRDTGLSPHAYQVHVRVRYAKSLLAQGISISQVAVEAGFFDQAHLTRHFKRIYGVTPGQYRVH